MEPLAPPACGGHPVSLCLHLCSQMRTTRPSRELQVSSETSSITTGGGPQHRPQPHSPDPERPRLPASWVRPTSSVARGEPTHRGNDRGAFAYCENCSGVASQQREERVISQRPIRTRGNTVLSPFLQGQGLRDRGCSSPGCPGATGCTRPAILLTLHPIPLTSTYYVLAVTQESSLEPVGFLVCG